MWFTAIAGDRGDLVFVIPIVLLLVIGGVVGRLADRSRTRAPAQHDLLDALPDGAAEIAGDRILWVNRRTAELFGYGRTELVGAASDLLVPPHLITGGRADHPASSPDVDGNEFLACRKDGSRFPAEVTVGSRLVAGEVRTTVMIRDTSERTRALEMRSRVEALYEHSEEAIIATSPEGVVLRWNPGAARMLGFTTEEAVGRRLDTLVPDELADELEDLVRRVRDGEVIRAFETRRRRKDGTMVHVSLTASGIRDRNGELVAFSATYRDITARKEAERALAAARQELVRRAEWLERSNEELRTFARTVAHDLSSPLAGIALLGQSIQADYAPKLDDRGRRLLTRMIEASTQMYDMIDRLLDFSQKVPERPDRIEVDMTEVVRKALAMLAPEEVPGRPSVEVDELPRVHGDPAQLVRLFQNLLGNAFKYRDENRPLRVHVRGQRNGDAWCFSVEDNGIGIDAGHAGHIFEAFRRAPGAQHVSGRGIGLAIAKHIVEWHGGTMWVDSQPGAGSTFSFTIPDAVETTEGDGAGGADGSVGPMETATA